MKINEIIEQSRRAAPLQPTVVQQQQRVGKVLTQIAASDQQQEPTEMDKVLAMRNYADMKKRNDKLYAHRLQQQLAKAAKVTR